MKQTLAVTLLLASSKAIVRYKENLLQLNQPYGEFEQERDDLALLPKEPISKDLSDQVKRYILPDGSFKTQFEVDEEDDAKLEEEFQKAAAKPKFVVPEHLTGDDTGTKYATTHRCFGAPCPEDLVQIDQDQPYGSAEADRDNEAGYPAHHHHLTKEHSDFAKARIHPDGYLKTEFEVQQDEDAELERKLQEARDKPAFIVPERLLGDDTGHKYVTTHRCFGAPCKGDLMQMEDSDSSSDEDEDDSQVVQTVDRDWKFSLGDMQQYKYWHQDSWKDGGIPHAESEPVEDVHSIIYKHFDPDHTAYEDDHGTISKKKGDFKSVHQLEDEAEMAAHRDMINAYNRPAYRLPDYINEDWTGTRYGKHWKTYGKEPFPPVAVKLDRYGREDKDMTPAQKKKEKEDETKKKDEKTLLQLEADPYDPDYARVDTIMKKWADKDAAQEMAAKELAVPGDPDGGLGKIYAASLKHKEWEDDKYLKEISEHFSSGGKGADGLPNRERILHRYGLTLAAEEVMQKWVGDISQAAIDKFINKNFDKVWKDYPGNEQDQIELREGPHFLRDLFAQEPGLPAKKNPLEIAGYKEEEIKEVPEEKPAEQPKGKDFMPTPKEQPIKEDPKPDESVLAKDKLLAPPPVLGKEKLLAPPPGLELKR